MTREVPWNSMELLMSSKLAQSKFHQIPWNCSCHWNWRIPFPWNSMEFHGAARVSEIGAFQVPWNSMEQLASAKLANFHGIPWNFMELLLSAKLVHFKFRGIQWNYSCQRNWRTSSSMEFHGTAYVSEIGAFQMLVSAKSAYSKFNWIPWNSMKPLVSAKLAHSQFHGIPWNSMELPV